MPKHTNAPTPDTIVSTVDHTKLLFPANVALECRVLGATSGRTIYISAARRRTASCGVRRAGVFFVGVKWIVFHSYPRCHKHLNCFGMGNRAGNTLSVVLWRQVDSSGVFPSLPRAFKMLWQIAEPHRRGSGGAARVGFCLVYDCHDCQRNGVPQLYSGGEVFEHSFCLSNFGKS